MLTLLLSAGVPLLLGGDELGRTQQGNNNAYCQDNEITWFDWSKVDDDLLQFTKQPDRAAPSSPGVPQAPLSHRQRRRGPALVHPVGYRDDAAELGGPERPQRRGYSSTAQRDPDVDADGTPMVDDDFLVLINAWWEPLTFFVAAPLVLHRWEVVCDSFDPARTGPAAQQLEVGPRSAVVMRSPR